MHLDLRGSIRRALSGERGSVTAEFAVVLPAVLAVLSIGIGGLVLASQRIALVSAAGEIARLEARGDAQLARQRERELGDVRVERTSSGGLLCVSLTSRPGRGLLRSLTLEARSCAARIDGLESVGAALPELDSLSGEEW